LFGRVLNTGYGEIKVLGGYSDVTITNSTSKGLKLNRIDVSQRGSGVLLIYDKNAGEPSGISTATHISGQDYLTLYQWTPTGVVVTTNGGTNSTEIAAFTGYTSYYQPELDWRYGWTTLVKQNLIKYKYVKSGSWLGAVPDIFQDEDFEWDSIEIQGTPTYGGSGPYYYKSASSGPDYTYSKQTVTTSEGPIVRYWHHDYWTWYLSHVYEAKYRQIIAQEIYHNHTLKADLPIKISFIGQATSTVSITSGGNIEMSGPILNPEGITKISTEGSLIGSGDNAYISSRQIELTASGNIGNLINPFLVNTSEISYTYTSADGTKTLNTPAYLYESTEGSKQIKPHDTIRLANNYSSSLGRGGAVYEYLGAVTTTVNLSTVNYFNTKLWKMHYSGTQDVVKSGDNYYIYVGPSAKLALGAQTYSDTTKWNLITLLPSLKVNSTSGNITITELAGTMHVDQITSGNGGDVTLSSNGAIQPAQQNSTTWYEGLVQGGNVTLFAEGGGIGASSTRPLILDSGFVQDPAILAKLNSLTVVPGAVISAMTTSGYFSAVGLTETDLVDGKFTPSMLSAMRTSGTELPDSVISAMLKTGFMPQEIILMMRNSRVNIESSGNVYLQEKIGDLSLELLNAVGQDVWLQVLSGGLYDANSVQIRDERTYEELKNGVWSSLQLVGNDALNKKAETKSAYASTREREYLTYWNYRNTTTDPTIYISGTTIGLTTTETDYYSDFYRQQGISEGKSGTELDGYVQNALDALISMRSEQYAVLHEQFAQYFTSHSQTFPTFYDPNFDYVLTASEDASINNGIKVWTELELLSLLGGGLLKAITDTTVNEEAPNIIAKNIMVIVSAGVGTTEGQTIIDLSTKPDPVTFTDDERVALAAAERKDIVYLSHDIVETRVNFNKETGTITSIDGTDWLANGFTAGMYLYVEGYSDNSTFEGLYYQIYSLTSTVITLKGKGLSAANIPNIDLNTSESAVNIKIGSAIPSPSTPVLGNEVSTTASFYDNGLDSDTIVRTTGSWISDGFQTGMRIRITGSITNSNRYDEYYTISSVNTTTITLASYDQLHNETGQTITIAGGYLPVIHKILINDRDDVDVTATGKINISSDEQIFLGSEENMDIETITSTNNGPIRIKSGGSILNAATNAFNVNGGDLILEAAEGTIGTDLRPFYINLSNTGELTARANGVIYILESSDFDIYEGGTIPNHFSPGTAGDMRVATIFSKTAGVYLWSDGSIIDGLDNEFTNIQANWIELTAGSGIGEIGDYLDINHTSSGMITATAAQNILLNQTELSMNVRNILSRNGDVSLKAEYSILDAVDLNDPLDPYSGNASGGSPAWAGVDIIGNNITLEAGSGYIGMADNPLDINSAYSGPGTLTSSSGLENEALVSNTYVIEPSGNLWLNTVSTNLSTRSTAFITTPTGSIYNGSASGFNIISGQTKLIASGNIGTSAKPLKSQVGRLEGNALHGGIWIENTGALSTGGVSGDSGNIQGAGIVDITAHSPITIDHDVISTGGPVKITSMDDSGDDRITVNEGNKVESLMSYVWLRAGDQIVVQSGSLINAHTTAMFSVEIVNPAIDPDGSAISGDSGSGNADGAGGSISLFGTINTNKIVITGGNDADEIYIDTQTALVYTDILGGAGDDRITLHQLKPIFTAGDTVNLDGQGGTDYYIVDLVGSSHYLINVNDTGAGDDGVDVLTINGTENNDLFLLRKLFVALINEDIDGNGDGFDDVERINYNQSINGRLQVNSLEGNDTFYVDDNSAITTLDGGAGNDLFQFGQLFKSQRDSLAGIAVADQFQTVETTRGWLSNGISRPLTAYGDIGNDIFQVYHNLAVLRLEGGDGDDTFTVRAFVVLNELSKQAMTYINSGTGTDKIQYVINAPVSIDGGDGTDTVVIIGTEFSDNFVITKSGVYGAGLNVTYENVEQIELDGMEGNDNFYILSTSEDWSAVVVGNRGSDTFNVAGDVDVDVISNDLMGFSAAIHHTIDTQDPYYRYTVIDDVSIRAVTTDSSSVIISESSAYTQVDETISGGTIDSYTIKLSKAPTSTVYLTVSAPISTQFEIAGGGKTAEVSTDGLNFRFATVLVFTPDNYAVAQTVYVRAGWDTLVEKNRVVEISHSINSEDAAYENTAIKNIRVTVRDNDWSNIFIDQIDSAGNPDGTTQIVESGGSVAVDRYNVSLTHEPEDTVNVSFALDSLSIGQVLLSANGTDFSSTLNLTFTAANWNTFQTVYVQAVEDNLAEGKHTARILHTLTSAGDSAFNNVNAKQDVTIRDAASVIITETNGSTYVIVGATDGSQTDTYSVVLSSQPQYAAGVDVSDNDKAVENILDLTSVTIKTPPNHGTTSINLVDGVITYTPASGYVGEDSFVYSICDLSGKCNEATVHVVNNPAALNPVAVDDQTIINEDVSATINVLENDVANGATSLTVTRISQAEHGIVSLNAGIVSYTPFADFNGDDRFTYMMCDSLTGACGVATARITINPVNDAPVARDDLAVTTKDTFVMINVSDNDNDVDTDNTLNLSSLTVTTGPLHGTVASQPDGRIQYYPASGYVGTDSFVYQIFDSFSSPAYGTATVNVYVNASHATIAMADSGSTDQETSQTFDVTKNDKGSNPTTIIAVTQPLHGSVTIDANNKVTYIPALNYSGQDSFNYVIQDADSVYDMAVVSVTVNPVAKAPIAHDDLVIVDSTVIINISPSDTAFDPTPKQLIFNASNWDTPQWVTVTGIDTPSGEPTILHFASSSHRVNEIRGPLEVLGGILPGSDRSLSGPLTLPTETNQYVPTGTVNSVTETTLTFNDPISNSQWSQIESDLNTYASEGIMFVAIIDPVTGEETYIQKIAGYSVSEGNNIITLEAPGWTTVPMAGSQFVVFFASPTLFVDETTQTDTLNVYNDGSPTDDLGEITDTRTGIEGSVSASTGTVLTVVPSTSLETNCLSNLMIGLLDSNGNILEQRTIIENTANTITVESAWTTTPVSGTAFRIYYKDPLLSKRLTGLGMGYPNDVNYDGITFSDLEAINIYLGFGNDTFNVADSLPGGMTTINSGRGSDTLNLTGLNGDLTINGGEDADTFNVHLFSSSTAKVILNGDAGNDTFHFYTDGISPSLVSSLDGGSGDDTYILDQSWGLIDSLEDSGGGDDTFDFRNVSDRRRVNITSTAVTATIGNVFDLAFANSLTHFGNTIEYILGGQNNDSFNFADVAALAIGDAFSTDKQIDGYTGTADLINYAAYSVAHPVFVDLYKFIATGLTRVENVENVTGGYSDDTIYGDDQNNVLNGSYGNDVLAGGKGNDSYMYLPDWGEDYALELDGEGSDTISFYAYVGDTITFSSQPVLNDLYIQFMDAPALYNTVTDIYSPNHLNFSPRQFEYIYGGMGRDSLFTLNQNSQFDLDGRTQDSDPEFTPENAMIQLADSETNDYTALDDHWNLKFMNMERLLAGNQTDTFNILENQVFELHGGAGDDTFCFSDGVSMSDLTGTVHPGFQSSIDGQGGVDTIDFALFSTAININLATGQGNQISSSASGRLVAIENLIGGSAADTLLGDAGDNRITGNTGNDAMAGGLGNDTFVFADGWGSDTVTELPAEGTDLLDFSAVTNDLTFNLYTDGLSAGYDTNLVLYSGNDVENLIGGSSDDNFIFSDQAYLPGNIDGRAGTNTLNFTAYTTGQMSCGQVKDPRWICRTGTFNRHNL
jgi:hypothetical protein